MHRPFSMYVSPFTNANLSVYHQKDNFPVLISGFSGMNQWRLGVGGACVHKWISAHWVTDWMTRMTHKPNYLRRAMHINFSKQKAAVLCSVASHPLGQKEQFAEHCCARAGKEKHCLRFCRRVSTQKFVKRIPWRKHWARYHRCLGSGWWVSVHLLGFVVKEHRHDWDV